MTISAFDGPLVTFPQNPLGYWSANQNPEAGPSAFAHGYGILDARGPFTYLPGQDFGKKTYLWAGVSHLVLMDQVPSAISANNLATSQSPGAGAITLTAGTGVTGSTSITNASSGATVTGLYALDGAMGSVSFGSAATMQAWDPAKSATRNIRITSGGNDTGITFTVSGYDLYGYPMSEAITGASGGVASGKKAFKYVASVAHTGSVATTVTVGTGDVFGMPVEVTRLPYASIWWGNPQAQFVGGSLAAQTTLEIPVTLSALANAQQYQVDVPFDGSLVSVNFRVTAAATTNSKLATLTGQVNATSVTGGVVALTSANCTPIGAQVAGTAITAGNTFTAGQTVGVVVSAVTAFVEGAGIIELVVQNADASGGTFTAAVTTTATTTTGDVRGTIAVPSASDATKRLTIFVTIPPANLASANGAASMYGVTQA